MPVRAMLNTNIHLAKSLSVEAEVLHRQIRSHQEWKVTYSPPLVFPNGTTLTSFTSSRTGTEFSCVSEVSVITIIDSESIEMIDGRGPNVCVAISTIGVQSRFQGSLHPGRVNGKQG
jgi:hypothetical protein